MDSELFEKRVIDTIREFGLVVPGDHVLVALSGGPDSTCLLVLLSRIAPLFRLRLSALYADHGLRTAEETGMEKAFCADLCRTLGASFDVAALDLAGKRGNVQQKARHARYAALRAHATAIGADRIATGHTLDDQAETVLMRLFRGSARRGLSGIPIRSEEIVRPLLRTSRRDIEAYLNTAGFRALTDSSNLKETYLRNRLRSRLLPLLESINPHIRQTLVRTARIFEEEDALLDALAGRAFERMNPARSPRGISWERTPFDVEHPALRRRILIRAVKELRGHSRGLSTERIEAVLRTTRQADPRSPQLPGGLILRREHDRYDLHPAKILLPPVNVILPVPGSAALPDGRRIEARLCERGESLPESPAEALVPRRLLGRELHIRTRRPGDSFRPLGMEGRKKLQDFFVDAKVPASVRDCVPLVLLESRIVWVAGYRLDHRFRCNPDLYEETVRLKLFPSSP